MSGKQNIFRSWAKHEVWGRHLGLWEALIDIVAPFYRPNNRWIDWENGKLILRCIPTSSKFPFLSFVLVYYIQNYSWNILQKDIFLQPSTKLSTIKSGANCFNSRLVHLNICFLNSLIPASLNVNVFWFLSSVTVKLNIFESRTKQDIWGRHLRKRWSISFHHPIDRTTDGLIEKMRM